MSPKHPFDAWLSSAGLHRLTAEEIRRDSAGPFPILVISLSSSVQMCATSAETRNGLLYLVDTSAIRFAPEIAGVHSDLGIEPFVLSAAPCLCSSGLNWHWNPLTLVLHYSPGLSRGWIAEAYCENVENFSRQYCPEGINMLRGLGGAA